MAKKKNPRKGVKMSIILTGNQMQLSRYHAAVRHAKVLTLKIFDLSYSCEQGCKFLVGNEAVK